MGTVKILFKGLNLNNLLDRLTRRGISFYGVKKRSEKSMVVEVKKSDLKDVLDATERSWESKIVGYGGGLMIKRWLVSRLPMIIFAVLFLFAAAIADGFLLTVSVDSVSQSKRGEILQLVKDYGVKKYDRFSSIDLGDLEKFIYKNSSGIAFVSVKKSGNRLIIDTILSTEPISDGALTEAVIAPKSGKLIYLLTLSGTPQRSVGDTVCVGDRLIEGWFLNAKEEKIPVRPVGEYTILCESEFTMTVPTSYLDGEYARLLAEVTLDFTEGDQYITDVSVTPVTVGTDRSTVTVKITYVYSEVL